MIRQNLPLLKKVVGVFVHVFVRRFSTGPHLDRGASRPHQFQAFFVLMAVGFGLASALNTLVSNARTVQHRNARSL
jgi:hypothetical protein